MDYEGCGYKDIKGDPKVLVLDKKISLSLLLQIRKMFKVWHVVSSNKYRSTIGLTPPSTVVDQLHLSAIFKERES